MIEETTEVKPKANIVFTGRLSLERLKELAATHGLTSTTTPNSPPIIKETIVEIIKEVKVESDDHLWNPAKNHNTISLVKQPDGHYIGCMWKTDQVITIRDLVPEHVLTQLLTHA